MFLPLVVFAISPQEQIKQEGTYSEQFIEESRQIPPRDYLRSLVSKEDFVILDAVSTCESNWGNKPNYLYDGENGIYTAYGPFQILKSTAERYSSEDRRDPYANVRIAVEIYKAEGLTPWKLSKYCIMNKLGISSLTFDSL